MSSPSDLSHTFPSYLRLRRPDDFRRVYEYRRSGSDGRIILYGRPNDLPHLRLGLSVSRKVGRAHHRNRLRRLYREAFRLLQHELPTGLDLIIIPRGKDEPSLEQIQQSLRHLVLQLSRRMAREGRP